MENTTDKAIFSMELSKLIPLMIGLMLATNTVSLTIQRLSNLEEKNDYNVRATKRRIENATMEIEYKIKIKDLEKELNRYKK
tara:strand:+ start:520 stop:765 length:246 start_codon:yes stop_codon:yes gene_type:complete